MTPEMKAGNELDITVATRLWQFGADGWPVEGSGWKWFGTDEQGASYVRCPAFSTGIGAAWEVVERMRVRFGGFFELRETGSIKTSRDSVAHDTQWAARFVPLEGASFEFADDPALAICLAALKAVTPEKLGVDPGVSE